MYCQSPISLEFFWVLQKAVLLYQAMLMHYVSHLKKKKFNKKESAKNIFFFLCISGQLGVIEKLCWRDDVLDDSGTIAEK